ncbi:MAG TPA: redox-regulated ATPase YchF, partial [Nitrospirae bacterium]|nr:redox-regulated ATPase YchF [Nitrospirota bacterium]
MKLAITGFSNSGKTTVFNALTGLDLSVTTYPTLISGGAEKHIGVVKVPDSRIDKLSSIYQPKKITYATVEYVDYVGVTSTASGGDISQNTAVFELIKDSDAIVNVVRAFEDEAVLHPLGSTDPVRDVRSFETELIFGDLEFVEKRLERMDLASKKGKKHDVSSRPVLFKCREALEKEISLRNVSFTDEEKRIMSAYQFLSTMPEIIVLNIGEEDINADKVKKLRADITDLFMGKGLDSIPSVILLCGKIEMEIAQLPGDEAKAFLDDLGIDEPAMNRLCRVSYDSLGLMSFFTVGSDEVKAWTIKKGTEALYAAGKIHSD